MIFLSLTRLRIRSVFYLPLFAVYTLRSLRQVRRASGFLSGKLLPDHDRTFWTMTAWRDSGSMRAFMNSGAHKQAMPKLLSWCDEASVAHWGQEDLSLPSWEEADRRMRESGRPSKVKHPSSDHAGLTYRKPRPSRSTSI
ncbi:MAG TPA: antibiotic biosynthesis monooxygenase [Acidobacteriaceae bacterium]